MTSKNTPFGVIKKSSVFLLLKKTTIWVTILCKKVVPMTTAKLIKFLYKQQNISVAELGRRIGQSRQNLYKKLQRDTLTIDEIKQIADALGVKFEQSFTLPGGEQFKIEN